VYVSTCLLVYPFPPLFQPDPSLIRWRIHLNASPSTVYAALSTNEGRASWWAESAAETDGVIHFVLPNRFEWHDKILDQQPPHRFAVEYIGGSHATFELAADGQGGTDLLLTDSGVPGEDRPEVIAGWVSVLLALKAAVDFGVDLRNHDPARTWDQGYADN